MPEEVQPSRTGSITPRLEAKNSGQVDGSAPARLVGTLKASMGGCTGGTATPGVLLALAGLLAGRRPYRRNR